MFSQIFINRPIFASVISIVILILGGFSILSLPVERYPDIAPPTITVSATYPGANAQTVADTVAAPIEQEVNGVEDMLYMSSVSSNDGTMNLTVTFATGTDLDTATMLTQNRVSVAENKLPAEVTRMGVTTKKKSTSAILYIAIYSPDTFTNANGEEVKVTDRMDGLQLSNYLNLRIKDELYRVPGVGEVQTFGVGEYSMRLWLDPEQLRLRGLTPSEVVDAIAAQNMQVAAGAVGEPPVPSGQAFQYTVSVRGRLVEEEEFENIVVRTSEDGSKLRVKDIARVELGSDFYKFRSSVDGREAASAAIYQIPGSNALEVAAGVKAKLEEIAQTFPDNLSYRVVYDGPDVIKASTKEVVVTLFITLLLVVFTVYIFLQNFRATLIPSVTIPVSLIGTFLATSMMGFSINTFTLFGLVLVIGIVVDDAIVVVENCSRILAEENCTPKEAASKAMREISGPVIATTLVLLSVFVPTAFMPGISGMLFQQFALTISMATLFSTLNALTLSPALCGVIFRPQGELTQKGPLGLFNRFLANTSKGYLAVVTRMLRMSAVALVLFIGMTVLSVFGLGQLPAGFVPQEDEGYCMTAVTLPDGASKERTGAYLADVDEILSEIEGVKSYMTISGYSMLDGTAIPNAGFSVVVFDHWDERTGKGLHQSDLIKTLNRRMAEKREGQAYSFPLPSLPGVGMSGGLTFMLQDKASSGSLSLQATADEFAMDGNAQSALQQMNSTFRANVPQLFVNIDREQVENLNANVGAVFSAIQVYLGSAYVNDFTLFGRVYKVKAMADMQYRNEPEKILSYYFRNNQGEMVPIGAVASIDETFGPTAITRYNMYPSAKIMGQPGDGFSSGQAMDVVEDMVSQKLSSDMGIEWTDLSYQEKMASGGTTIIFVLAIVLVYLVLAAQYESWSLPISVVMAVPTGLLGAVGALMIRGMENNIYTQVGIVLLIGLCTKTAILIVEFAKVEYDSGKSIFDAALSAARLRFRAVLMTAFSFVLGVLPLLVASGAGAVSRQVLGTTVFGGMLVATILSLIFVPVLFFIVQSAVSKKKDGETTTEDESEAGSPEAPSEVPAT